MSTLPVALCDICTDPGRCCRKFVLNRGADGLVTHWDDEPLVIPNDLPFEFADKHSTHVDAESGRTYSAYWYSCPKLGPGGRCTIYAERPQLCRDYAAGSDGLCAMYRP